MKPACRLIGADGNIFNLLGIARKALREAELMKEMDEMTRRVYGSGSYEDALRIIMEYVEVE